MDIGNQSVDFSHKPLRHPITETLAVEMLDGILPLGTPLTLENIQERFSISRTVAREVAGKLESVGAVDVRRRIGLLPRPVEEWTSLNPDVIRWKLKSSRRLDQLRSLTELRVAIEPAASFLTATRASIDQRGLFPPLATKMRQAGESGNLELFHKLDAIFHSLILQHSGNDLFAAFSDIISAVLRGRVELDLYPTCPRPIALDLHDAVATAIWEGNGGATQQATQAIVDEVSEAIGFSDRRNA
ncbi:FCD domain-containing protein [Actinotignum urinale]|uniref:FadR/GntR family transcriptional regulator n=1 Tax=Actinotignum urinale TaxID=190146 RepID=UPI000C7F944E|nr:FCD domain-containing protein [Actinotignum urinale]WIK58670.1 FCD domain-containing protein [Actinotignum urinale]